jgi:sporulation protein YlmC with PRC-barrel domain
VRPPPSVLFCHCIETDRKGPPLAGFSDPAFVSGCLRSWTCPLFGPCFWSENSRSRQGSIQLRKNGLLPGVAQIPAGDTGRAGYGGGSPSFRYCFDHSAGASRSSAAVSVVACDSLRNQLGCLGSFQSIRHAGRSRARSAAGVGGFDFCIRSFGAGIFSNRLATGARGTFIADRRLKASFPEEINMKRAIGLAVLVAFATPAVAADALSTLPADSSTLTNYYKQDVYDNSQNTVGKIDDVLIDKSGKITALIVGVGGFLGIGEKDVALPFSAVKSEKKNDKWYLTVDGTKDSLKNAAGYKYDSSTTTWIADNK